MAGRSPAAMSAFNMQGNDFNAGMFMNKDQPMMGVGPQGMRPPTSNMQQGGRPTQFQGGQPMQQQGSQTGQQMGTPGQRNDMPPPQAPAGGNSAQRNSGNSPPTQNQPPTPSQTSKPNPKNKKNAAKDDNKKQVSHSAICRTNRADHISNSDRPRRVQWPPHRVQMTTLQLRRRLRRQLPQTILE